MEAIDQKISAFQEYYARNAEGIRETGEEAKRVIEKILLSAPPIDYESVTFRVKTLDSAIEKIHRFYSPDEGEFDEKFPFERLLHDLLGVRVICYYSDDVTRIIEKLKEVSKFSIRWDEKKGGLSTLHYDQFGYTAHHIVGDLGPERRLLPEYQAAFDYPFEIQVRTIVQHAWSFLSHKLSYKKGVSEGFQRQIHTLAALSEVLDNEFIRIRDHSIKDSGQIEDSGSAYAQGIVSVEQLVNHFVDIDIFMEMEPKVIRTVVERAKNLRGDFYQADLQSLDQGLDTVRSYIDFVQQNFNRFTPHTTALLLLIYQIDRQKLQKLIIKSERDAFNDWFDRLRA